MGLDREDGLALDVAQRAPEAVRALLLEHGGRRPERVRDDTDGASVQNARRARLQRQLTDREPLRPQAESRAIAAPLTFTALPDESRSQADVARRLEFRWTRADSTAPASPSRAASWLVEYTYGPQSWFGEYVSHRSGTERRYGIGAEPGHASCDDSVRPPELDE